MPRDPEKPWYWAAQDVWVVQLGGKRHRLAKGQANRQAAVRALRALLNQRDQPETEESPSILCLLALYLEDLRRRRDGGDLVRQSKSDVERRLAGFDRACGDLTADQIRPRHVQEWLDTQPGWGATTRHDAVGAVKTLFRWAKRQGHIRENPLSELEKPRRRGRREEVPDPEAAAQALSAAVVLPSLADLLGFLHETGCRPKEARDLEARHLDLAAGVAVLAEHKTARKTGRKRVLYLSPRALAIVTRLAAEQPEGPIFRNSRGRPWTKDALVLAMRRLRERTGLGKEVIAYGLRHLYITDALAREVPVALVAEMAGHSDLRMISTYSHVSERHEALRDAAARVRGDSGETPREG